jgi:hypothetical protein
MKIMEGSLYVLKREKFFEFKPSNPDKAIFSRQAIKSVSMKNEKRFLRIGSSDKIKQIDKV